MLRIIVVAVCMISAGAFAQEPAATPPPSLKTHQVNADDTITFRFAATSAKKVELEIDAFPKPLPMTKDRKGVWSVTTPVMPPEYYGYQFLEDGVAKPDPLNVNLVSNYVSLGDRVLVPGVTPMAWELTTVPHGRIDHYLYTTHVAKKLPEDQEAYDVYTPPGYDAKKAGGYPVLYLLHGWSDGQDAWTAVGEANLILDRLLAEGKIVPMIVVMPLGYGDLRFVLDGWDVWQSKEKIEENRALFSKMLLTEILPAAESEYDVAPGRDNRAIAGLSMGGLESLTIGMNHPETFAYVGGMSAAIFGGPDRMTDDAAYEDFIPHANGKKANLKLLWVACGKTDNLLRANRDFVAWAESKKFNLVTVGTEGAHNWLTWRVNLMQLAPLLFRGQ